MRTIVTSIVALILALPAWGQNQVNPSTQLRGVTYTGSTKVLATSTGTVTSGHLATWDASGNIIDGGALTGTSPSAPSFGRFTDNSPNLPGVQGIAEDGSYHYNIDNAAIYKLNYQTWATVTSNLTPFASVTGYNHLCDGEIRSGKLYIVAEHTGAGTPKVGVLVYNTSDLSFDSEITSTFTADMGTCSSLTFDTNNGIAYISQGQVPTSLIFKYDMNTWALIGSITVSPSPADIIQGVAFKDGILYADDNGGNLLSIDPATGNATTIYTYTLSLNEMEGLDYTQDYLVWLIYTPLAGAQPKAMFATQKAATGVWNGVIAGGNSFWSGANTVGFGYSANGIAGSFGAEDGAFKWVQSSGFAGVFDSSNGVWRGLKNDCTDLSNTTSVCGFYQGMGVRGNSTGSGNPIFGVMASGQSGNGANNINFTVYGGKKVQTYNNTLDDGSGKMTVKGMSATMTTVTFSATPTFNAAVANSFKITLTNNVTSSTLSNAAAGQELIFLICQDATGSRTFVWPSNVKGAMTIGSTLSTCNSQSFIYDGTNAYATSPGVTNQ